MDFDEHVAFVIAAMDERANEPGWSRLDKFRLAAFAGRP